jgi:NDP-sugar pyrophosphorylase family protein
LVHNVDILSDADLSVFYEEHLKKRNATASLLVSNRISSRYLLWDESDKLIGWTNLQTGEIKSPYPDFNPEKYDRSAFSGIHILSPEVFEYMSDQPDRFSIIDFYLSIADKINIYRHAPDHLNLVDVGKPENLPAAEQILQLK